MEIIPSVSRRKAFCITFYSLLHLTKKLSSGFIDIERNEKPAYKVNLGR